MNLECQDSWFFAEFRSELLIASYIEHGRVEWKGIWFIRELILEWKREEDWKWVIDCVNYDEHCQDRFVPLGFVPEGDFYPFSSIRPKTLINIHLTNTIFIHSVYICT